MQSDATAYFFAAAALAVALWTHSSTNELQAQIGACEIEYHGFREGVIYGK